MSQHFIEIEVERRETSGKKSRREIAKLGMIPGVVYGGGKDPVPIAVDPKKIIQIMRSEKGQNSILLFSLKGTKSQRHVMVKDFQIEPTTNRLIHADFKRIMLDEKIRVKVPIQLDGVAWGIKNQGGIVDVIMREVELECLPSEIPDRLHVDLTPLKVGDSIKLADLKVDEKVKIWEDDLHQPIVVIAAPRVEAEPAKPAEEGAEEVEPEVIGRGKKPAEGEEGEGDAKAAKPEKGEKAEKAEKPEKGKQKK
jgi:large subunit ribosomal protein L25